VGNVFPAMYSMLSSDALLDFVASHYDVGTVTRCKILTRGLNDTYRVSTDEGVYILRVYRTPWRTKADVLYELDALEHLHRQGVSVSVPVKGIDGEVAREINAPEGTRYIVLFTYAGGTVPILDKKISYEYGKIVAQIHHLSDSFSSSHQRARLDLDHLLDEPLAAIAPAMTENGGDVGYIKFWVDKIKEHLPVDRLNYGFCHGDFHDWNAHWDGRLTIFDFDCCGTGFRAYDLAVFLWNLKINYQGKEADNWQAFLTGYTVTRPLAQIELDAIPLFVAARRIWLAGIYVSNEDVWGTAIINERFFRTFVDQLKDDEREQRY